MKIETKTPQDYHTLPHAGITDLEQIQGIHGNSYQQGGILIAKAKDADNYLSILEFELVATQEDLRVDQATVKKVWLTVVRRHSLLWVMCLTGSITTTFNIILRHPERSWFIMLNQDNIHKSVSRRPYQDTSLQHHLFIQQVDPGRVSFSLAINHSILGAYSISIFLRDFKEAYIGSPDPSGPPCPDFIAYLA